MTYVIVYCGYEGIEHLLWAGQDKDAARGRVEGYRAACRERAAADDERDWHDALCDMDNPDRVCVMGYVEGNERLTCYCAPLGVPPSKLVLL